MAKTVAIDVQINAEQGAKSLKDLKQDLKDLQSQISLTKEGSEEYYQTLQKIGQTKDQIDDLKDSIAATTGGGQFQAIANIGGQIANGFQMAQAAMAVFGGDAQELQKHLQKAQAAMQFAQGIKQLEGLGDQIKNAGLAIQTFAKNGISALKSLWATMAANPITAILVAITALAAGIAFLMNATDDETEAIERNISARQREMETMKENNDLYNVQAQNRINLLKAQGASEQTLFEETKKLNVEKLNQEKKLNESLRSQLADHIKIMKKVREDGDEDEIKEANNRAKELQKALLQSNLNYVKSQGELKTADAQFKTDEKKRQEEHNEKLRAAGKAHADKVKQQREKEEAERKAHDEKIKADIERNRLEEIKNLENQRKAAELNNTLTYQDKVKFLDDVYQLEIQKAGLVYEDLEALRLKNIEDKKKLDEEEKKIEEEKEKIKKENRNKELDNQIQANESEAALRKQKRDREINDENIGYEEKYNLKIQQLEDDLLVENENYELKKEQLAGQKAELEELERQHLLNIGALQDEKAKTDEERDKAELERKKLLADTSLAIAQGGLKAVGDLTAAFAGKSKAEQKKAFEVQKGINIAMATIDTYKAATAAFASAGNPIVGAIFAAIAVAAGIANIAKISQTQFEDKSGPSPSGGGGAPTGGSFNPNLTAPVSSTSTNLASIGFGDNKPEPVKVFVTETDISSNQNKVKSIEQKASIE